MSELLLTILTQNSADTNAEVAFEALRAKYPSGGQVQAHDAAIQNCQIGPKVL